MKILLVNPPDDLEAMLGKGTNLLLSLEPLGLLYVAAVAREAGYDVRAIDAAAERMQPDEIKQHITKIQPAIIGFTVFTSNGGIVYDLGRWVKQNLPDTIVVLGNTHAEVYAEQYLRNGCCDAVIHGEGEYAFLDLVRLVERGCRDFTTIPSVSSLKNGAFVPNSESAVLQDLSRLPWPARDLLKRGLYNFPPVSNLPYSGSKTRVAKHMFTSRGCPYRCTFCTVHKHLRQRFNEVRRVVDEMEFLVREYKANYIFIMDSLFISNKQRVMDICNEIRARNLDVLWGCEAHVRFIDEELVRAMEAAGCYDMAFGIESGVQRLLNVVRKGTRLDRIEEAVKTVKRNSNIVVSGLFILGLPGETYADSLQTIRFAKSLPLDMAQFSILTPYPGSQIFEDLKEKGEIDTGIRPDGILDTSVWLRYSAYISYTDNDPIWVTPDLMAEQLKKLQKRALREFYFRPKQFFYQLKRVRLEQLPMIIQTSFKTFFK